MPAPTFVISVTAQERTPVCPLKNSNALLTIFVLPIDLRSFISITRVLNELLINPVVPIVAPPAFSKDEPACDRSPRHDDSPKVPEFHPCGHRTQARHLKIVAAACFHFRRGPPPVRPQRAPRWRAFAAKCSSSRTWLRNWRSSRNRLPSCSSSRNRLARSPGVTDGFDFRSFDPRPALEEVILINRCNCP